MVIARERYLDDGPGLHVTIGLATRTVDMHGVLSELPADVHARLGDILVRALDEVAAALAAPLASRRVSREGAAFGCGT